MKKFLALFTLTAMLLASVVIPISATTSENSILSVDFEDFETSWTTAKIAEELGWTWNADVADLKIVETVYAREVTEKLGGNSVLQSNSNFIAGIGWDEGNGTTTAGHEGDNCNHRIVTVADLKQYVSVAENVDFSQYTSYSKRLLIVPKTANADISVTLAENINIGTLAVDESIVVDYDFTANKLSTYGWESESTTIDFANTSSIGINYTMGTGNVFVAMQADGKLAQVTTDDTTYDGSVAWGSFYSATGSKYGSGVSIGTGTYTYALDKNYNKDNTPTSTETAVNTYLLHANATANGLTFGLRSEFSTATGYSAYARSAYQRATNYVATAWTKVGGDYTNMANAAKALLATEETMDISLNYSAGMSFYLDNIVIKRIGTPEFSLFAQDFEDFDTSWTTAKIAEELGWTDWNAEVADLKIVETVYAREVTTKLGGNSVLQGNAALNEALGWTEGSTSKNHENQNCNHRIIDVATLKEHISAAASVNFSEYTSYSKRLLIVPKVANADISVMLMDNIDISRLTIDQSIVADWEFTANKLTTIGWAANSTEMAYSNTSSVGLSYTIGTAVMSTAIQADAKVAQTLTNGEASYDSSVLWDKFYTAAGKNYGSGVHCGQGASYVKNYTVDATTDPATVVSGNGNLLYHDASANGLTFGMRSEFSGYSGYTAYANSSYTKNTGYPATAWNNFADNATVTRAVRDLVNSSDKMSVSLNYSSGVSFYVDNINIKKVRTDAQQITVKVDGKDFTALAGQPVAVAAIVDSIDNFLIAIAKDASNTETVYGLNDKLTPTEGMSITPYTVNISASKAERRTNSPEGIRWVTEIDKDSIAKLEDLKARGLISKIEIGTVITPKSYADLAGGASMEKLSTLDTNFPYVLANATFGTWYKTSDTSVSFAGSVVDIIDTHKSMDYVGCGFIKLTIPAETEGAEPTETIIYAPFDATASVANATALAAQ